MNDQDLKLMNNEQTKPNEERGQSIIEYTLILALLGIALGLAIAAAGPAVGNTFENVVFNLLQQTPEGEGPEIGGPVEFWLTVTWLAQNPQLEVPLPTRTPAEPSTTPTTGPSPTPSPVTPTRTPVPSNTPVPSPTPPDITVVAPWIDEADPYANTVSNPEHWRVDNNVFVGYDEWCGEYYPNTNLSGTSVDACNEELGFPGDEIDMNWGNGSPIDGWPAGNVGNNFSIRFTRDIYVGPGESLPMTFTAGGDDGFRLYIDYTDGCTTCLVINQWNNGGFRTRTATRTLTGAPITGTTYELRYEFYESGGGARALMLLSAGGTNPDDTPVNDSGNPVAGAAQCNWGRDNDDDSLSMEYQWEEYVNGDFPRNTRCHLEFRGYVYIANGDTNLDPTEVQNLPDYGTGNPNDPIMLNPEMVFWDVWEFDSNRTLGWLEIAEYVEVSPGEADRGAMSWTRIPLHQGSNQNYNWTRHTVDLTNVGGVNFSGKRVAFRFVMENRNTGSTRRWYIDDVEFRNRTIHGEDGIAPFTISNTPIDMNLPLDQRDSDNTSYWNLNFIEQTEDFITSPEWQLTGRNANPADGGCCSFEDSPGTRYRDHDEAPNSNNIENARIHYVEFNGWIDIGGAPADREGHTGSPMLSFYQGYILGRYTGLELQYSTSPYGVGEANWQVVPGTDPADPYGRIRNWLENGDVTRESLNYTEILLSEIPATRFRLRFAMIVRGNAGLREGWWIDTIRLERESPPGYLDYPFFDSAEVGLENWLPGGSWFRTNQIARDGFHSFTDSPGADYAPNANSTLRFSDPIDMFNDTPTNLALTDRNPAGGNTAGTAAVEPVMTFWHRRDLSSNDNFHVEWRRLNEDENSWKPLWSYIYGDNTRSNDSNSRSRTQLGWERVEIDMRSLMDTLISENVGGVFDDDDIYIRFRLYSDNSNVADGVYIDNIDISEREDNVFRVWPLSENRSVGGTSFGNGSGTRFSEDVDSNEWWQRWHAGGGWQAINWEQNSGLQAFHESTNQQIAAPYTPAMTSFVSNRDPQEWTFARQPVVAADADLPFTLTAHDTFNVLELATIIDLRATDVTDNPILYFWNRFHVGNDDEIRVQISRELDPSSNIMNQMNNWCGGTRPNCYEHIYGWGEWITVWEKREWSRTWTWEREQISLINYAASGLGAGDTPGSRIRVRFLLEAYDNADNRDGWYIDDIVVENRDTNILATISSGAFFDDASNLSNWVTEGEWGLSPELFRDEGGGGGGTPASLGIWNETWWDCDNCANLRPSGTRWRDRYAAGADVYLDADGVGTGLPSNPVSRLVTDINYPMNGDSPADVSSSTFDETRSFVGRWVLDTPVVGTGGVNAGDYSFITVSDDGVRMKIEEIDAGGNVISPPAPSDLLEWNVIYNWNEHGRTADMGPVTLDTGRRYRITLEYFQNGGGSYLTLSLGGSSFSFTDSPKQGAGPAFSDRPSVPYSNSSLILDGIIDLAGTTAPVMEYFTYYEIDGRARVEVSIDGGFTWRETGLQDGSFDDPSFNGAYMPANGLWRRRQHDLTRYVDQQIMVRFRFDRQGRGGGGNGSYNTGDRDMSTDGPNGWWQNGFNANSLFVGWWVVDIRITE